MKILLTGWEGTPLPTFLVTAGATAGVDFQPVADVATALTADDAAPVLVFCRPATETIRHALADGSQPSAAVVAWCDTAKRLLDLCQTHHPRLVPVDLRAAESRPAELLDRLGNRLGHIFADAGEIAPRLTADLPPQEALLDILARTALRASSAARTQLDALEAAGLIAAGTNEVDAVSVDRACTFLRPAVRSAPEGKTGSDALSQRLSAGRLTLEELRRDIGRARALLAAMPPAMLPADHRQRMGELETALHTARTELAEAKKRVRKLETRLLFTSGRLTATNLDLARSRRPT